jgi:hypothetical protein
MALPDKAIALPEYSIRFHAGLRATVDEDALPDSRALTIRAQPAVGVNFAATDFRTRDPTQH